MDAALPVDDHAIGERAADVDADQEFACVGCARHVGAAFGVVVANDSLHVRSGIAPAKAMTIVSSGEPW
jgi:hypothetical protein